MADDGESNADTGPVTSFASLAAEGDLLYKQGEMKKAIETFSKALHQRPTDKHVLIARSKCYLQVGNPDAALQDAETALNEDKDFFKAKLQKAEAMYAKGDFELALVHYHRGHIAKPEITEFRLGIQKAREAIENSIGDPNGFKLKAPSVAPPADARKASNEPVQAITLSPKRSNAPSPTKAVTAASAKAVPAHTSSVDTTAKALLAELYVDKEYLTNFLADKAPPSESVTALITEGLKFLEARTEFWRQQKPIYARRKDASKIQSKVKEARARQTEAKVNKEKERKEKEKTSEDKKVSSMAVQIKAPATNSEADVSRYIKDNMDAISKAHAHGDYEAALKTAKLYQNVLSNMGIPDKARAQCEVYHEIGSIHFDAGNFSQSFLYHNKELALARQSNLLSSVSQALGNIGRCHTKQKKYQLAITAWTEKLQLSSSPQELAWLHHDIGRCFMELNDLQKAIDQGLQSSKYASEASDKKWQMTSNVLLAQAYEQKQDINEARKFYKLAHDFSVSLGDARSTTVIESAMALLPAASTDSHQLESSNTKPSAVKEADLPASEPIELGAASSDVRRSSEAISPALASVVLAE